MALSCHLGVMELNRIDATNMGWSSLISLTFTTRLIKFLNQPTRQPKPRTLYIHSSKQISKPLSTGLQKNLKKDLSRILRTETAIRGIEFKANSRKYKQLWPKAVLEALDEAIIANRLEPALKIFGLLRKQQWYKPRCQTYTKLLVMLGKCQQPDVASFLFEAMLSEGLNPTIDVYTALVGAYGQSGLFDEAFSTIDDMKSVVNCKPDVYTYTILIRCCIKFRRFDLVDRIFIEMAYLGIECSIVTHNTIIDGYGKAKMFEHMEDSLTNMIESGNCLPDVFTLNSVIGAYGNSQQIEKMEKWYDEFGMMSIKPDIKTFNILIKSYGKAGLYGKMKSILDFMEKRFFSPTIVTYNIIIDVFGKSGEIDKLDSFFTRMKHLGVKPNSVTYCSIVSAYSKTGCIEKVDSVLRQVENTDVILDTPFFNCIITAYARAGNLEKMHRMFMKMKARNCAPNSMTFATMIQAYNAQGKTEAAQKLESEITAAKDDIYTRLIG